MNGLRLIVKAMALLKFFSGNEVINIEKRISGPKYLSV